MEDAMDEVQLSTLYVVTEGAYLHRDGQAIVIEVEKATAARVPLHMIESIACFGRVMVSPSLLEYCAEQQIAVNFMTAQGRLMARVDAPASGNVQLRRQQFRLADNPEFCLAVSKCFVAGKIQNARQTLLRSGRDIADPAAGDRLRRCANLLAQNLDAAAVATTLDSLRGQEGDAARVYFEHFSLMTPDAPEALRFAGRSRRPPLDPINAILSFFYSILTHDCTAALVAAGLDPSVGFLHEDRPGRPSLALDMVEEFRAPLVDRFVITLINRKQIGPDDFETRSGGTVLLTDAARKRVITAFQQRKMERRIHPHLQQEAPLGRFPALQAKILARHIRGDLVHYVPAVFK
jgi:CRISPR-associated protein Cas1